jgi:uncharacterized coiled-coil protein SlyX
MARRRVKVAKTHEESETRWADQYFKQWQEAKEELHITQERLAEYRADYELQEKTIAELRAQINKASNQLYAAGMDEQRRLAVERIKQWVADNVAITGFDTIYTRLVNAVVWAVELKAVDKDQPAD